MPVIKKRQGFLKKQEKSELQKVYDVYKKLRESKTRKLCRNCRHWMGDHCGVYSSACASNPLRPRFFSIDEELLPYPITGEQATNAEIVH